MAYRFGPMMYFAKCGRRVKIGHTEHLPNRVHGIRAMTKAVWGQSDLELWIIPDVSKAAETTWHQRYANVRASASRPKTVVHTGWTEWFYWTDRLAADLEAHEAIRLSSDRCTERALREVNIFPIMYDECAGEYERA